MMRMPWRPHPSYEMLSRHADRDLPPEEAMRVNAHLAQCRECRDEVDFRSDLRARLRQLPGPSLPRGLLPEILSLRAMGERVILESEPEPTRQDSGSALRAALPVAATLVLLGAGVALFSAGDVEAGASSLDLRAAESGTTFPVEYRTAGPLAGEHLLQLRGEYYAEAAPEWEPAVAFPLEATLNGSGAGLFTGELSLPGGTVYARFAVETPDGLTVDGAFGGAEFLARKADGTPTFDALLTKSRVDYERGDIWSAIETANRLTGLYESRADGWLWRAFVEHEGPEDIAGRSDDTHDRRLQRFLRELPLEPAAVGDGGHGRELLDPAGLRAPDRRDGRDRAGRCP